MSLCRALPRLLSLLFRESLRSGPMRAAGSLAHPALRVNAAKLARLAHRVTLALKEIRVTLAAMVWMLPRRRSKLLALERMS
jgi:hypothetical protein